MEVKIFESPQFGQIRTSGTSEQPLFCAADICAALGFTNGRKAIADHCDEADVTKRYIGVVTGKKADGTDAEQQVLSTFINESGLYALILGSKLQAAKKFKHWVTSEVLPTIRRTGGYTIPQTYADALALAAEQAKTLELQAAELKDAKQHIAIAEETIEQNERQLKEQAPKVMFADAVATSEQSVLVKDVATVLAQNGVKIGQNRLFQYMRDHGYLGRNGEYYNQPTQRAMEMGLFELKKTTIQKPDGTVLVTTTPKVTGKGQIYFVNHLLKERA